MSTINSWKKSLYSAIGLGVEHISAYSLSYEKGTPLSAVRKSGGVEAVSEDVDRDMYEIAIDILGQAGYVQYEVSNFARKGYECQHNLGYWRNEEYIGVGPAAGSYWEGKRLMNVADINGYVEAIESGSRRCCGEPCPF